jgi:26S proteasome non-ATPase regulatory subunit 10
VVQVLLDKGADVSIKYDHGKTALHMAAERGYERIVQMLREKGAV